MEDKGVKDNEQKREKWEGKLYLDNLIISYLQSTSMDAPSLHQAAHCEDRAMVLAGLSISHYLSREGVLAAHTSADQDMQTLMAIHQPLPTLPNNYASRNNIYTNIGSTDHISMLSRITFAHQPTDLHGG